MLNNVVQVRYVPVHGWGFVDPFQGNTEAFRRFPLAKFAPVPMDGQERTGEGKCEKIG